MGTKKILKDLTGQKFGRLTVMERANNRNGKTYWKCRCDCGNIREVYGYALTSGHTVSCGCAKAERISKWSSENAEDLTGQKFGRLTVIKRNGYTGRKRKLITWLCKCDCGNMAIRTGKALKDSFNSGCDKCRYFYDDLTGRKFGVLTVISRYGSQNGDMFWNCKCKCGNVIKVSTGQLNFGHVVSCGCSKKERIRERSTTHGLSNTRLYEIWVGMKRRCYNSHDERYADYGGRGIIICDEWKEDFQAFYDWAMTHGYADNLTIERKDVNGNYCPENCCWITKSKQSRNRRITIRYTLFGIEKPLAEWCEYAEIKNNIAYQRYRNGNPPFDEEEMKRIKSKLENGGS